MQPQTAPSLLCTGSVLCSVKAVVGVGGGSCSSGLQQLIESVIERVLAMIVAVVVVVVVFFSTCVGAAVADSVIRPLLIRLDFPIEIH